jgi:hypothetical protein
MDVLNEITPVYMCPVCYKLFKVNPPQITVPDRIEIFGDDDDLDFTSNAAKPTLHVRLIYIAPCHPAPSKDSAECNCLIPLDMRIANIVSEFNKKGYRTRFSCEGHWRDDPRYDVGDLPAIVFEEYPGLKIKWALDEFNRGHDNTLVRLMTRKVEEDGCIELGVIGQGIDPEYSLVHKRNKSIYPSLKTDSLNLMSEFLESLPEFVCSIF